MLERVLDTNFKYQDINFLFQWYDLDKWIKYIILGKQLT